MNILEEYMTKQEISEVVEQEYKRLFKIQLYKYGVIWGIILMCKLSFRKGFPEEITDIKEQALKNAQERCVNIIKYRYKEKNRKFKDEPVDSIWNSKLE